jgi:hypothetical protein
MKRSTRKLNNKNKNKAKQMGGTTREEWDDFTRDSLARIEKRQKESGSNDAKTKQLLDFAKDYYELAWKSFQIRIDLQNEIKQMSSKVNSIIKDLLPDYQLEMDKDITEKFELMELNMSPDSDYNKIPVNTSLLEK